MRSISCSQPSMPCLASQSPRQASAYLPTSMEGARHQLLPNIRIGACSARGSTAGVSWRGTPLPSPSSRRLRCASGICAAWAGQAPLSPAVSARGSPDDPLQMALQCEAGRAAVSSGSASSLEDYALSTPLTASVPHNNMAWWHISLASCWQQ